jgi:Putative zinc-finger
MSETTHIAEKDLLLFLDGELQGAAARRVEAHLEACQDCRSRLEKLRSGTDAYEKYHQNVLKPSLQPARDWPELRLSSVAPHASKGLVIWQFAGWWAAAAAACLAAGFLLYQQQKPGRRATRLLEHAMNASASPRQRLEIRANGQKWYRPAVLNSVSDVADSGNNGLEHTRAMFVKANYSWDDPLSARSFAAWRNRLLVKRDQVVSLRGEDGIGRFYRVRTETAQGVLRSASLTLNAHTFRPVEGMFHFEDREDVTMTDSGEMPEEPAAATKPSPIPDRTTVETKVTPEDELRVFAALNTIGVDAGEPVTVEMDTAQHQVVVKGVGISAQRQREIRQALNRIPNASLRFETNQPAPFGKASPDSGAGSIGTPEPLRRELELKAGGAQNFQQIADRALDASSSLLAQAHALEVLAQQFPPALEMEFGAKDQLTLKSLRRVHARAIDQAISQVHSAMKPLLNQSAAKSDGARETQNAPQSSWQSGAAQLFEQSKLLDKELNRLLASDGAQQAGEDILNGLPDAIQSLEKLAHSEASAP